MQNIIKYCPEYNSILNNIFNLMYVIDQSVNEPLQATYQYLLLTEYPMTIMNAGQKKKEVFMEYM